MPVDGVTWKIWQRDVIQAHSAVCWLVNSDDQPRQRGFAGARRADNRDSLTRTYLQADVVKDIVSRAIREGDSTKGQSMWRGWNLGPNRIDVIVE